MAVLVEFEAQAADSFSNFLDLKESLEALFQRSVDLVELRAIRNRRLRYYIEQIIDLCRSVILAFT